MQATDTTDKVSASYIAVTPDTAKRWLDANTVNRNMRKNKVRQYATDMAAGRWMPSNDAICFAPDGKLLNGQHRLTAVIESGITVTFLVVRNMPLGSMTAMDQGAARSGADALKFAGERSTAILAAASKQILLYTDGRLYQDNKVQSVSHGELLDFVDTHPTIRLSVEASEWPRKHVDCPPSPLVAAHWIIGQASGFDYATHYVRQLATRTNEPDGSAVLAVDSRLREVRRNRTSLPPRNFIYLLIKGWNYYAIDQRVKQLSIAPKGKFRIPDPVAWQRSLSS